MSNVNLQAAIDIENSARLAEDNLLAAIEIETAASGLVRRVMSHNPGCIKIEPASLWSVRQDLAELIVMCSKLRVEIGEAGRNSGPKPFHLQGRG